MLAPGAVLKVASVSIPYPGPDSPVSGLFVQRRVEALARLANVSVISPRPWFPGLRRGPTAGEQARNQLRIERPRMFYLPGMFKGLDGYWLKRAVVPVLRRLEEEDGLDLVDSHFEYPEGVGCVLAARSLGLPVFVTLRGLLTKYLASPSRRRQCLWALHQATGIVSVAHSLKRLAVRHGISEEKIRVIPNGVDSSLFHAGLDGERRGCADADGPLVVAVGAVQEVKGQHVLVPAFARVRDRHPRASLVIIGDHEYDRTYTTRVRGLIRQLGLEGAVVLVGKQPPTEVARWLRRATIFALPSFHEGCCNAVLEALACGAPVVTTPVGDNAEQVQMCNGGILAPVGDASALGAALLAALEQSWDRAAIASSVARRGWDHVAEETCTFFHERLSMRISRPLSATVCK